MQNETRRLYDENAYETEFTARVISCTQTDESYAVILDRTLFFPEEGGQTPDCGVLGDAQVLDVQIKENVIIHTVDKPLEVGSSVKGSIDWKHRFYNMQQHSGEHIFSGLVHKRFGHQNVGFHLSNQIVTMDFDGPITQTEVKELELAVNEVIAKNVPIIVSFPSKEELETMSYRSKIEIEGQVRIVTIPGYDVCACCAPHVKSTGEIGMLKVMDMQNYKGGVRISILCGFRALNAFNEKSEIITALSRMLSAKQEDILSYVERLQTGNQQLKTQLDDAKKELMEWKLNNLDKSQKNVFLFESGLNTPTVRNAVNRLVEEFEGVCGVFAASNEGGYSFIIGSKNIDCKSIGEQLKNKYGIRGGGSEKMIQGFIQGDRKYIENILADVIQ